MKLWIRRQFNEYYDKESNLIICPNRISINKLFDPCSSEIVGYEILGDNTSLGLYYDELKANKVFEDIISWMEKNSNDFKIFQMPSNY